MALSSPLQEGYSAALLSPLLPRPFSAGHETFVPILAGTPKRPGPTHTVTDYQKNGANPYGDALLETNCRYEASAAAASWQANDGGRQRKTACPLLYRYRLTHTARSLACPLLTLSSSAPSFSNCIFRSDGAPCARPLPPSSDRSAGQRNQTSHITVLARPVCQFVRVIDPPSPAGFLMIAHLSRLASFSDIFGAWFGVWDWIHSHTPPRTRSPSSPPSFHTLSLSPEFTSVWWSV